MALQREGKNLPQKKILFVDRVYFLGVILIAIIFGFIHSYHVATLFENSRHFSHLSAIEREMSFRTEMGLYYSYFKTIIESPSFATGIEALMRDNRTEYPDTINTLQRFNLYPEVAIAAAYKGFVAFSNAIGYVNKECWQVHRGSNLPPVESCEGLGDPACFYVFCTWVVSGLTGAIMFLYGYILSDSILGGFISVSSFFYNHGECTRVQWTPPLRESFGFPIALMQMFILTYMLKHQSISRILSFFYVASTVLFMLVWQFAAFVLATQMLSLFVLYLARVIDSSNLKKYLCCMFISVAISYVLLFCNELLLSSPLVAILPSIYIAILLEDRIPKTTILKNVVQCAVFITIAAIIKMVSSGNNHDSHIWNLLRAKLFNYTDFHTSLYTCAVEFGFMEIETVWKIAETLLLPLVLFNGALVYSWVKRSLVSKKTKSKKSLSCNMGDVLYNWLQMSAFAVMAVLIMRLKVFFTPHLCVLSSLICSRKLFTFVANRRLHLAFVIAILSMMSVKGIQNLKSQRNIIGEYTHPALEELIDWVETSTAPDSVFAGPMPTMANLMLSTRRAIVNHPHYEDEKLRSRTIRVYSLYSRKASMEVHRILLDLRVDYAVLEDKWCYKGTREGCTMLDMWDIEDPANVGNSPFCDQIKMDPAPFRIAFQNAQYLILSVH